MTVERLSREARTSRTPTAAPTLTPIVAANVALRGLMEIGLIAALGVWGLHLGAQLALPAAARLVLAIGLPALGFGFWGAVDFRGAGRLAEPLRLLQELGLTGVGAAGLALAGHPAGGVALATLSLVHHALVYALGQRLLKE